jgi:hypothetical protein
MTRLSEDEKRYLKYHIYSFRYDYPWITNKKIAQKVNRSISTVNRYAAKAEKEKIISPPTLWLNSHFKRAALLLFKDKWRAFKELQEYSGVYYVSVFQGDWDIIVIYDTFIDFSHITGYKGKVIEGVRGKVFTQKVTHTSWAKCYAEMENCLEHEKSTESCFDCGEHCLDWDEEDWVLFDYFRDDLRKSFRKLRKENFISWRKYGEWKKNLKNYCTILLFYFPEGSPAYDSLTLGFKTAYEPFIVQLFSMLPVTTVFYKIADYVFANIFVPWEFEHQVKVYDIISRLIRQKTITDYMDGNRIMYWYSDTCLGCTL